MADGLMTVVTENPPKAPEPKAETPDPTTALRGELDALKKENAVFTEVAKNATREAEKAKAFAATLTAKLQEAATSGDVAPGGDEAPTLDIRERMAEDPLAVMDEHYRARTAPLVDAVAQTQAKLAREVAVSKLSTELLPDKKTTVWGKYGEEIDKFLEPFPAAQRSSPDAYVAAAQWVRSKHIDEEISAAHQARIEEEKRAFSEAPTASAGAAAKKPVLSDAEKTVARKLGLTEEEYMEYR